MRQAVRCGMESLYLEQKRQKEEEVDWKRDEVIHALVQALRRELIMGLGGVGWL